MQGDISAQLRSMSLLSLDLEVNKIVKKIKKEQPTTCHSWSALLFKDCSLLIVSSVQNSIKGDKFARN